MNLDKASSRKSRGGRAGEVSRQELLAKISSDRAVREASRRRLKAAVYVQRVYRGWSARSAIKADCITQWLQQYSNAAADLSRFVPALEISGSLLPLILQACKALITSSDSKFLHPGSSYLFGSTAVALRGTFALLLRSIGSAEHELNFCALAVDKGHRLQWLRQSCQLISLCSAVLQIPFADSHKTAPPDSSRGICTSPSSSAKSSSTLEGLQAYQLLQTASARLLMVLTSDKFWKCFQPGGEDALQACQRLLTAVSHTQAMPLALRSLVSKPPPTQSAPAITNSAESENQPRLAIQAQSAEEQKHAVIVQMTVHAALRPLTGHVPASSASTSVCSAGREFSFSSSSPAFQSAAEVAAAQLACTVMTAPELLIQLPATARKQLTEPLMLSMLMTALHCLASHQHQTDATATHSRGSETKVNSNGGNQSFSSGTSLKGNAKALVKIQVDTVEAALTALGNLAGMVCGERVSKPTQGDKLLQYLPKSKLLQEPGMAEQFLATASCLLQFAFSDHQRGAPAAEHQGLSLMYNSTSMYSLTRPPPHTTPSFVSDPPPAQGPSFIPRPPCFAPPSSRQVSPVKVAAGLLDGLWPLAEGTFITQLLDNCDSPATAVAEVASFYHGLLDGLPRFSGAAQLCSSIVNALSFGCRIQQSLWRWCAMTMGLPLEAPKEATRGWDVATLRAGMQGLNPDHAPKLGLFCRLYAHTLLVLDDDDFYERQDTFTLAQQRGIATVLNALVFRTYCPACSAASSKGKVTRAASSCTMLATWAPVLLRAMYERNVRRAYCPTSLWLEPYHATTSPSNQGQQGADSAGAIVRSLLQAQSSISINASRGYPGWPAAQAGLLGTAPQCIPFEQRLLIFRALVAEDKERGRWDKSPSEGGPAPVKFTIHRGSLLQNGWAAFQSLGVAVKGRLVVSFVNEQGMLEAGLDYGGLVKEFLEQAISTGFNADYGLFTATADGLAYPQPAATTIPNGLGLLEFLGLVVGKALYEGILLDVPLAPFFVARLQGRRPMFDDLAALDAELYRSLVQLKRYDGDATDLCLDFSVEDDTFGARSVHSLVPGGSQVAVTDSNKLHYIHLAADWHLNGRLGASSAAFARGLAQVIPPSWLKLFNTQEVNQLLGGGESGVLDVADMAAHAQYSGGYSKDHATVKLFWKVMSSLNDKERQAVMRFVTSCSRAPLGGFQHLTPPLTLHKVPCEASLLAVVGGKDVDRLPSASTCYNMLKLPNYRRASTLKEKLLYAVTSNAGFELS